MKQDRTCCLKLAPFRQFGFFPMFCADLEMKSTERGLWRDDRAVSRSSWQSWSLMPLCLSLAVNLFSLQPLSGCSWLLLIVSLKLKFVITYWCMASWQSWAWTALTAVSAWWLHSLYLRWPVVNWIFFPSILVHISATYSAQRWQESQTAYSIILQCQCSPAQVYYLNSMAALRHGSWHLEICYSWSIFTLERLNNTFSHRKRMGAIRVHWMKLVITCLLDTDR